MYNEPKTEKDAVAYRSGFDVDSLVVQVHPGDNDGHFSGTFES